MSKSTIRHVAERAGVSLKTVSRVINAEGSVSADKRERVLEAIAALRFKPNMAARNLRGSRAYSIGLVYDNPNAYYVIRLQEGVLNICRDQHYGLLIHPCDADAKGIGDELVHFYRDSRLAGMVLAPPMSERADIVEHLTAAGIPFVRIVSGDKDPDDGTRCVYVNDRAAAREITEHLIRLGHHRIGFLWGEVEHGSSGQRYQGYVDALQAHGIEPDPSLVLPGRYAFDSGFAGGAKLLSLSSPPTAIFGSNDEIAAGVLVAAKSRGLDVPRQLSIAGFEDSPFSRQSWPALTTARQSTADMARAAADMLIRVTRAQGDEEEERKVTNIAFAPELVVRDSTIRAPGAAA